MSDKKFEIVSLTMRYWFIGLIVFIALRIFTEGIGTKRKINYREEGPYGHIIFFMMVFISSAYALLAYNNPKGFDKYTAMLGLIIGVSIVVQYNLFRLMFPAMDKLLLIIVDTLAIFGFIMLYRFNVDLAIRQIVYFILGNIVLLFFILFTHKLKVGDRFSYALMVIACVLLLLPIFFGEEKFGAVNWIEIKGHSLQPSEFVKIILIYVFASQFKTENTFKENLPAFIFVAISVLLVVFQRDLGAALLYFYIFIFVYYIASSDWIIITLAGIAAALGSVVSYHLFSHVRVRVEAWKNPWRDIEDKGYQIAHSLIAISSGGLIGTGLGLGSPQVVPAFKTDFIFASLCEEFGILTGLCIIGLYAMIVIRGVSAALRSKSSYKALLALGATVALSLQAFTIIAGVIKMIPLTGITMPFVSYGGSSMVVSLAMIGIIEGVAIGATSYNEEDDLEEDETFLEGEYEE